jgi:hypothetical protein
MSTPSPVPQSPLKKDKPKKRWTYKPIPSETWEAIRNESPAFVVQAIKNHAPMLELLREIAKRMEGNGFDPEPWYVTEINDLLAALEETK